MCYTHFFYQYYYYYYYYSFYDDAITIIKPQGHCIQRELITSGYIGDMKYHGELVYKLLRGMQERSRKFIYTRLARVQVHHASFALIKSIIIDWFCVKMRALRNYFYNYYIESVRKF